MTVTLRPDRCWREFSLPGRDLKAGWCWLEHEWIMTFQKIGKFIIPTDELIFFRGVAQWIFPCWFQPSSLVTCPTLYTYLMPLWLRGPLSHFVAEIIRSGAMENSAWALRLLTGECSICSYQYNSLPSELPLLHGSGAGTLKGPASVRYLQAPTVGTICVPSSSEDFQSWGHWSQPERHLSQCEAWRLTRRTPSEIYNSMGSHQVIVTSGERWFWV